MYFFKRELIWSIFLTFILVSCATTKKHMKPFGKHTSRSMYFDTQKAMYAANEEWLTFACDLPDGRVNIGTTKSMDMYYYSMYGLGNLLFRSGLGVHIVHNPLFSMHVKKDKGMPWYQKPMGNKIFFMHKIAQFLKRTRTDKVKAKFPPKGVYPVFLEYAGGVPTFMQKPVLTDFRTLRWDPKKMDRTMNPGAWGQSLMKQVLWARDFFTGYKKINGVIYLGNNKGDGGNGFRGAALIAQAITKSFALKSTLAFHLKENRLGPVNPKTYQPMQGPIYYPHQYRVVFAPHSIPPKPVKFEITDKSSHLFDVASLLWAESEFYFFTDPTVRDDYNLLFGDARWNPHQKDARLRRLFKKGKTIFPKKPHQLAKGLSAVLFKNMMALHFQKAYGTFVDVWTPENKKGNQISMFYAAMASAALANTYERFHDLKKLKMGAKKLLQAQVGFLLKQQRPDGSVASSYTLKEGRVMASNEAPSLLAQSSAIRAWMAAYRVTKDQKYFKAAEKTFHFMETKLWSKKAKVYRSQLGAIRSSYGGWNFGATLGALRELAIYRKGKERRAIVARLDQFFDSVANQHGMQLAELGYTGEMMPSRAKKMSMMKMMKKLMKTNPKKAKMMKLKMMDSDGDGVPKPPFVHGTKFGAAPVQVSMVSFDTP